MNREQFSRTDGQLARRYEYDESVVLAVDFGPDVSNASVDLVDGTVIVVVDRAERRSADRSSDDEQYEFDLPAGVDDAHTFIKNGVLTVEMEAEL